MSDSKSYYIKLLTMSVILLSESFSANMIFPLLPFMIRSFGVAESDEQVGYYAGYLASAFFVGQFLSSNLWGYVSDHYGRKITMMFGLLGNAVFTFMFGRSKSLWLAVLYRGLTGVMNGNVAAARTYLKEISTEERMARSFSIMGLTWGVGSILGSFVGGALCMPCEKYPDSFHGANLFCKYPFLLPCIVACAVALFGLICGSCFLEETLKKTQSVDVKEVEMDSLGDVTDETSGLLSSHEDSVQQSSVDQTTENKDDVEDEEDISIVISPTSTSPVGKSVRGILKKENSRKQKRKIRWNEFAFVRYFDKHKSITEENASPNYSHEKESLPPPSQTKASLPFLPKITLPVNRSNYTLDTNCYIAISLYCVLGFTYICFDEVYPLFAFLDVKSGGLGFESEDIGHSLLGAGAFLMVFQMAIYPIIDKKFGSLTTFKIGSVFTCLFMFLFPNVHYIAAAGSKLIVFYAVLGMAMKNCFGNMLFTPVFILIAR
eukprot:TRINITY_DN1911_c0_g1_i4.p1 TRINITY_DN1911_c0_g1~~TRINITY_DN1911_c0_g1_i4.p1  ORF type:complete len:490 (+),score=89.03 TRINITY_DN1911_c0_g1_i4:61-1530(+)